MERVGSAYVIAAGPPADTGTFALFRWSGKPADKPRLLAVDLGRLRPEAIFAWPDGSLAVLSDDGGLSVGKKNCKDANKDRRSFRALELGP